MLEAFSVTDPTIAHVCGRLKLSRSTLLRRLDDEGITFQSLLDETRKELAIRYLVKSNLNNQQIAHLVGYRDPNAFQRAFRKWTGMTPQDLRAEQMGLCHLVERRPQSRELARFRRSVSGGTITRFG
jgi:AraC-like DNA-binding protein